MLHVPHKGGLYMQIAVAFADITHENFVRIEVILTDSQTRPSRRSLVNSYCRTFMLAIAIAPALIGNLPAAIVSRDFLAPNDGLLTYDVTTGREWLDILATYGVPINALPAQLAPGGILQGFKLASLADVDAFVKSAGFDGVGTSWIGDPSEIQDYDKTYALVNILSGVHATGGLLHEAWLTSGLVSDGLTEHGYQDVAIIAVPGEPLIPGALNPPLYGPRTFAYIATFRDAFDNYPTNPTYGFWLFRDAAVPEPSTVGLLAIVLPLVCARRLRGHAASWAL